VATIDAEGVRATAVYDAAGQTVATIDGRGVRTTYGYDAGGRNTSLANGNGRRTTFAYLPTNLLQLVIDPLGNRTTHAYDADSRRTSTVDPLFRRTTYGYDAASRRTGVRHADGTRFTFAYDADGNRVLMADPTGRTTLAYDAADRLVARTGPTLKTVTLAYDADGRTVLRHVGGGTGRFTFGYDAAGRQTLIINPQRERTTSTYDVDDQLTRQVLANGVTVSMSYDAAGRLRQRDHLGLAGTLSGFRYRYNRAGVRTQLVEADGGVTTWAYDAAYQLTRQRRTSPLAGSDLNVTLTYDAAGNPAVERTPTTITTSTYDAADRLARQQAGAAITTFAYDAAGRRTLKLTPAGVRVSYAWDDDGRLKAARPAGAAAAPYTFTYDADGLRFERRAPGGSASRLVWDGWVLAAEADGANNTKTSYTQGTGPFGPLVSRRREAAAATDWPLLDGLGSMDRLTDAAQAQTARTAYDAYGLITVGGDAAGGGDAGSDYVAALGYLYDPDLGLYYVRQRWYDPQTKQWVSPDPVRNINQSHQIANVYIYSLNRPTILSDGSGLQVSPAPKGPSSTQPSTSPATQPDDEGPPDIPQRPDPNIPDVFQGPRAKGCGCLTGILKLRKGFGGVVDPNEEKGMLPCPEGLTIAFTEVGLCQGNHPQCDHKKQCSIDSVWVCNKFHVWERVGWQNDTCIKKPPKPLAVPPNPQFGFSCPCTCANAGFGT
jgi:RHS repeat-associated protein